MLDGLCRDIKSCFVALRGQTVMTGFGSSRVPASRLAIVRFLVGLRPASGVSERLWLAAKPLQIAVKAEFFGEYNERDNYVTLSTLSLEALE